MSFAPCAHPRISRLDRHRERQYMRHGDDEQRCEKRCNAAPSHCEEAAEQDDVVGELIGWNRPGRRDAETWVHLDFAIVSDEMRSAQPLIEREQPLSGESEE